jgi:hypothetical protein
MIVRIRYVATDEPKVVNMLLTTITAAAPLKFTGALVEASISIPITLAGRLANTLFGCVLWVRNTDPHNEMPIAWRTRHVIFPF